MLPEWGHDDGKVGWRTLVCSVCGEEWETATVTQYGATSYDTEECPVCLGAPREDE